MIFFFVLFISQQIYPFSASPISNPLLSDAKIGNVIPDYFDTKASKKNYHNSTGFVQPDKINIIRRDDNDAACNVDFKLKWSTNVGSSVYSSPVIFPSGPDGKKQIFLNTYHKFVEIIGYDGFKPWGWPLSFEGATFHGSPVLYDVDGDGTMDVGMVDTNANLFWIRMGAFGQYLEDYHTQIPKLKVTLVQCLVAVVLW